MDVDKLLKMNALASELKKHNFASSSDVAYHQAEQIYETGQAIEREDDAPVIQIKKDALEMRRVELLLEMNNKKYEQQFEMMRNAINTLVGELNSLKDSMQKQQVSQQEKPKEKQVELKTEEKQVHPRQGNFSSSDVDIQKMFYFGRK